MTCSRLFRSERFRSRESARIKQPFEEWKETLLEWFEKPVHKGWLLHDLGFYSDDRIEDEADDGVMVQRAFFTQDQALNALGFKRPALNHLDNMEWVKMTNALKNDGWLKGRHRIGTGSVGRKNPRIVYYPEGATDEDFHLGYRPVEAEPPTESHNPDEEDLI